MGTYNRPEGMLVRTFTWISFKIEYNPPSSINKMSLLDELEVETRQMVLPP